MESLRPNTIEEVYELSDAIMADDLHNVAKELGDVLLHVVFYSKIGDEKGSFDIADVCNLLCDKLVYRHPHVFGDTAVKNVEEVLKNWEQLKQTEKDGNKTVLSGVPSSLPSLIKAYRMQDKARAVGFDWEKREEVWAKVKEEIAEFEENPSEEELGDIIFSLVNAARLYDLNPDTALEKTNGKFRRRFGYVEEKAKEQGRNIKELTLEEMDALWNEAKTLE